jgi:hypothetical protein
MNRPPICSAKDDIVMCNYLISHNIFTDTVEDEPKESIRPDYRQAGRAEQEHGAGFGDWVFGFGMKFNRIENECVETTDEEGVWGQGIKCAATLKRILRIGTTKFLILSKDIHFINSTLLPLHGIIHSPKFNLIKVIVAFVFP